MTRFEMLRWDLACNMMDFLYWLDLPYKVKNGRMDHGWLNKPHDTYVRLIDWICPGGMPDSW